tara:strand:+ start:689 stop:1555 length:867 start_codon:yes stop_codon:yes gene_type:complete
MIKIVLHSLPHEIDQVQWIVDQLVRGSRFINPQKVILDFTLNLSDNNTNWEDSLLPKEFFIEKFNLIFNKSPFINQPKITSTQTGCNSVRRNAIRCQDNTTHIVYLDTDLIFPEIILYYIFESINQINIPFHIISPQIFQLWDASWDIISHPDYRTKSREHKQWLKNPYQVFEHEPKDIKLIKTPYVKFGGGWFNTFSKPLLELIDIPDSLGHYGMDDTFVAEACNILLNNKYDVQQFVLNDIIVKEDRVYRSYSMEPFITKNSQQDIMRSKSLLNYNEEILNFKKKI